jgi:hypothetical protein
MENTNDGWIATLEYARYAAEPPPIGTRRRKLDENLVPLHGAVDLVRRDKDVIIFARTLPGIRSHESISIAVKVQTPGEQILARRSRRLFADTPVLTVRFDQIAARSDAGKLFQQQTALAPSTQTKFPDKLLVTGFGPRRAPNVRQQFAIVHKSRVEQGCDAAADLLKQVAGPRVKDASLDEDPARHTPPALLDQALRAIAS